MKIEPFNLKDNEGIIDIILENKKSIRLIIKDNTFRLITDLDSTNIESILDKEGKIGMYTRVIEAESFKND
jgi:hypothetical protein